MVPVRNVQRMSHVFVGVGRVVVIVAQASGVELFRVRLVHEHLHHFDVDVRIRGLIALHANPFEAGDHRGDDDAREAGQQRAQARLAVREGEERARALDAQDGQQNGRRARPQHFVEHPLQTELAHERVDELGQTVNDLLVELAEQRRLVDHDRLALEHFAVADQQRRRVADEQADEVDGDGLVDERFGTEDEDAENVGDQTQKVNQRHDQAPDQRRLNERRVVRQSSVHGRAKVLSFGGDRRANEHGFAVVI